MIAHRVQHRIPGIQLKDSVSRPYWLQDRSSQMIRLRCSLGRGRWSRCLCQCKLYRLGRPRNLLRPLSLCIQQRVSLAYRQSRSHCWHMHSVATRPRCQSHRHRHRQYRHCLQYRHRLCQQFRCCPVGMHLRCHIHRHHHHPYQVRDLMCNRLSCCPAYHHCLCRYQRRCQTGRRH